MTDADVICSATNLADIETVETGFFRFREQKGAPWQALRVMYESGCWVVLLNGAVVSGSGTALAKDVPFLLWRAPFHRITEPEYDALLRAVERAPPGHPLRRPADPVDLRAAPGLYQRKST